jgi:peptide/nickel transport system substrate-binding protein
MYGYNASTPLFKFNKTVAAAELALAINPATGNSWAQDGFRLVIWYNDGNEVRGNGAMMFAQDLMSLPGIASGKITVEVKSMAWNPYITASDGGVLACYFLGWAPDYADPQDYVQPFLHSQGLYGATNHLPDTLDSLIEQASQDVNSTTRAQTYSTLSQQVYENVYYLWTTQATNFHVEKTWINGWYFNPMYSGQYFYALTKG